VVSCEPVTGT